MLAALGPFADAVVYGSHAEAVAEAAEDRGGGVLLAVADGGRPTSRSRAGPACSTW